MSRRNFSQSVSRQISRPIPRRAFLASASALAFVALLPEAALAKVGGFSQPVAIPPLDEGRLDGTVRVFDLAMQPGETEFFPGLKTKTAGINASYLGPALHFRKGEDVRVHVTNKTRDVTTLHWHGFNIPARADGGPHQMIRPGETWSPEFKVLEEASTMWAHSHTMGKTAEQVWSGLAQMVVISDEGDAGLPANYGTDDFPVVLQDRRFYRDGSMPYEASRHDLMAGMQGNIPLVNGTVQPYLDVTTKLVRLRVLNGANASIYNLGFDDNRLFHQVASDGGLLAAPVPTKGLRLAPGERAELVVSLRPGERTVLQSRGLSGGSMPMMEQSPAFDFLELRAAATLADTADLPATLATPPLPDAAEASQTRHFLLEMPGMGMGMVRNMMGGGGFTINGDEMDMDRIDFEVSKGATEIWEIENAGPMMHPFHVHNTQFRILDRNGAAPEPHEAGRKDTVLVEAGETVRIAVRFDHYADPERPYMYHCHILEHEDAGMMGQFTVV